MSAEAIVVVSLQTSNIHRKMKNLILICCRFLTKSKDGRKYKK